MKTAFTILCALAAPTMALNVQTTLQKNLSQSSVLSMAQTKKMTFEEEFNSLTLAQLKASDRSVLEAEEQSERNALDEAG